LDETDPSNDEILIAWDSEIYQEDIFEDVFGNALMNSAGDYFIDPSPNRDASHLIAKLNFNVLSVPVWALSLKNTVNDAPITIDGLTIATGLAKVQRMSIGNRMKRNDVVYRPIDMEIHIHEDGWLFEPLDAGFRERDDYTGELKQIVNELDGEEVTSPAPLDGAGHAIDSPTPENAIFGSFTIYRTGDLTVIPGVT